VVAALSVCAITPGHAQSGYRPGAANLARASGSRRRVSAVRALGRVYSVLGDGEWVMNNREIPIADYEKLPALFNPVEFDPVEWVALAKAAGMKYITITSKHHDGFAMFDSKVSDYNIVRATPYQEGRAEGARRGVPRQG
jgi:alpha-L-fucosidase